MKLKSIYINRQNWGDNEGKLSGKIEFDNFQSTVALNLSEEQAAKIVGIVAEDSVRYAHELSQVMLEGIIGKLPEGTSVLGSVHVPKAPLQIEG